jgi:phage FluMu protein Com
MQLRCTYCQTMFSISQDEMLAGLEHMEEHKQAFYDAHCPKCRRANRVERARMERFFPDWKKAIKTMAKESSQAEAPIEKPAATVPAKPASTVKHQPAGAKKK